MDSPLNRGVRFDGEQFIEIPKSHELIAATHYSIALWFRPVVERGTLLFKGADGWHVEYGDGLLTAGYGNGRLEASLPLVITTGEKARWHHLVLTQRYSDEEKRNY